MSSKGKGSRAQKSRAKLDLQSQQIVRDLNRKIKGWERDGDLSQAFMGHSAKAFLYFNQQKWSAAAREFEKAANLAAQEDQLGPEAQTRLGAAISLENLPQKQVEAQHAYQQVASVFAQMGNLKAMLDARQRLAGLAAKGGDFEQAALEMTAALEHLDPETDPGLVIEVYRNRAQFRMLQANLVLSELGLAVTDLDEAIRIAEASGDAQLLLSLKAQRQMLQNFVDNDGDIETLSTLLQEAVQIGNMDVASDLRLQQAQHLADQGKYEAALTLIEATRKDALHSEELGRYIRYLMACIIEAGIRDVIGDRPGVIAILLTCKKTLEKDLGTEVGSQINKLLDSLADRWGPDGLKEALQTYREQMAAQ